MTGKWFERDWDHLQKKGGVEKKTAWEKTEKIQHKKVD